MTRHVAHVEARGLRTRRRLRRQRNILAALSERYAALPPSAGGAPPSRRRPIASFAFSVRTSRRESLDRLTAILDQVDPGWRRYVKVWDGFRG